MDGEARCDVDRLSVGLADVELAIAKARWAHDRWVTAAIRAAGGGSLSGAEVLILLAVCRAKRTALADVRLVLSFEHTHSVSYAVRKLCSAGLMSAEGTSHGKLLQISDMGAKVCSNYLALWRDLVANSMNRVLPADAPLSATADAIRLLSGLYAQAARSAALL
ncbi:hypothetical protein C6558_24345 [Ensifer sp. NM-2]|uniref:winged helix DNA-binding protein n=1 Tax=Ensifer sp. NM-2 TaxID=2109730 RepID=UPI000D410BC8|nr:winged helix DNA-binding protein [Ensifer sp. NM-2]PSS61930.1 hypothetical protein C6558_24345 [Ensifer sp. NM-2]